MKGKDTQQIILYNAIFDDCRRTIDWIHTQGDYKKAVVENLSSYIAKDPRAIRMMQTLSKSGKKLFLLTNSPWLYTKILMTHVMGPEWQRLFDVVIVEGNKPKWLIRVLEVKELEVTVAPSEKEKYTAEVFLAGCASDFKQRMGLAGKDILYVGDHIFGDVLKSKKAGGWRTLLIVPELDREMKICSSQKEKFKELIALNNSLSASESSEGTVKKETLREISKITDDMEIEYGAMGSLLRYADIYTCNAYNIAEYSPLYYFNSPIQLLPHEEKFMQSLNQDDEDGCEEEDS
ncbi:HAD superfamily hydrolase, 5'-nucleotidase [Teladorsagia circumcincta]|uniref:HAD superfamily hydrolase, 5'-nucleotidase n=1 Tax=Teladorsagia circumcincta TaxID=45464 RepID=A0A2G9V4P4_TELCI|nr:HAD superfamily hydrolase, 5'-nucleotidase [Teladorsagia circumcincta]